MGTDAALELQRWLDWQEGLNSAGIDLGLERVREVGARLGVLTPAAPVFTVAGTNGKGSVVAYLEAMLTAAGYRCGAYTSPHLLRYNERVRVDACPCSDEALVAAFEAVEAARGDVPLTYFEFGTLAALWAFDRAGVEALVLEVGLGGRLDAVNAVDPDVAVIASIGLDHADWLGDTLDAIAREKAGVMRPGRPVVFASPEMPAALWEAADAVSAPVAASGRDFVHDGPPADWQFRMKERTVLALPTPGLAGPHQRDNAAAAIAALQLLSRRLPVDATAIARGIAQAHLPGRCQTLAGGGVDWLVDVAHNADAAAALAQHLRDLPRPVGRTWAVVGAMARKERAPLIEPFAGLFDGWFLITLPQPEAWAAAQLAEAVAEADPAGEVRFSGAADAVTVALNDVLRPGDRVVLYGSFHTVEWLLSAGAGDTTRPAWLPEAGAPARQAG